MLREVLPIFVFLAIIILIALLANHYDKKRKKIKQVTIKYICSNCGHKGLPETFTKGSCLIELILWFFFIIPGLIYTVWRISSRHGICPSCKSPNMIPENTPKGQKLIKEFHSE